MKTFIKFSIGIASIVLLILAITGCAEILVFAPGLTLAFAAGAGEVSQETVTTQVTSETSSELLNNFISKKITQIKPQLAPLDTILRHVGKTVNITAWRTEFYQVDVRGIASQVNVAFDTSASSVSNPATGVHTVSVTNIHIWNVDDNIWVQGVNGVDGAELVLHIIAKNATQGTVSVIAVNGLGTGNLEIPDLSSGTHLVRIGNAKSELDAQTTPYTAFPQKDWNYCQVGMAQVEQSTYDKLHDKEVKWDIDDFKAASIWDMRRSNEFTSLFGYRNKLWDPEGEDWKHFAGGCARSVGTTITFTDGALTDKTFIGWCKTIFTGNSGSETRFLFAGSDLIKQMSEVSSIQKQIDANKVEVLFGIKFKRIETNFGTLLLRHHHLFNDVGWTKHGLVLDLAHIERHVFKPMEIRKLELKKSGQRNADAFVIDETFCLATRYEDTHFKIEPA